MPRVRIEWLATRTQEQREELARRITQAMVDVVHVRPEQVTVVYDEKDPALMIKGGVTWTEILQREEEAS